MARTKTNFKSYSAARAIVKKLGLRTMQDWINFSKGKDPEGRTRPKDIPSNPWTIYSQQLMEQGKKFSINEFLGSKPRMLVARKEASKRPRAKVAKNPVVEAVAPKAKRGRPFKKEASANTPLSYNEAKSTLRKMHAKTRADVSALVRMKLLPSNFPKNPVRAYKEQWQGWDTFLGNKNKNSTEPT